jgi:hypothetical protein
MNQSKHSSEKGSRAAATTHYNFCAKACKPKHQVQTNSKLFAKRFTGLRVVLLVCDFELNWLLFLNDH